MQSNEQRLATAQRGLSDNEAAYRLKKYGSNEIPRADQRTWVRIVVEVLREPMLALLLASGFIYLAIGELNDALLLVAFAMLSIVITVVQEART
jgi:Ca2+-transporting ATPase